jgi:Xaa-Pro aminopeptidase
LRADVTKTRKNGSRGRLKIDYGNPREPQQAIKWLWKFIDAAATPGELYGRALVVLAAEQYALRLVLPTSQRMPATSWGSHKDLAAKALKKLAGPHVPASLTKLEQAVKRAHNAHAKAEQAHHEAQHAARPGAEQPAGDTPDETATEQPVEEELDELDAEAV